MTETTKMGLVLGSIGLVLVCISAYHEASANARADKRTKAIVTWSAEMPAPSEVRHVCRDAHASSSVNYVKVCDRSQCAYQVELLPGCQIEYVTTQGTVILATPAQD